MEPRRKTAPAESIAAADVAADVRRRIFLLTSFKVSAASRRRLPGTLSVNIATQEHRWVTLSNAE